MVVRYIIINSKDILSLLRPSGDWDRFPAVPHHSDFDHGGDLPGNDQGRRLDQYIEGVPRRWAADHL